MRTFFCINASLSLYFTCARCVSQASGTHKSCEASSFWNVQASVQRLKWWSLTKLFLAFRPLVVATPTSRHLTHRHRQRTKVLSELQPLKTTRRKFFSGAAIATSLRWSYLPGVAATAQAENALSLKNRRYVSEWKEVPPSLPQDSRRYAYAVLPNAVRAIIISDAGADDTQLVVSVKGGSLDDPGQYEGLAHLAEHITLRSAFDDEDFESGDVNGFTARRTTTFEYTIDADEENTSNAAEELSQAADRFAACFELASSTNESISASIPNIRKEILRVDAEMVRLKEFLSTDKRELELASLIARASPLSAWSRLGRGDKTTLRADTDNDARAMSKAIISYRTRYFEFPSTLVVKSPVPLEEAVARVGKAFSRFPEIEQTPEYLQKQMRDTPFSLGSKPFLQEAIGSYSKSRTPAFAIQYKQQFSTLALVWEVDFEECGVDATREKLTNPLEIIGHLLKYPHPQSLASELRRLKLSPLSTEKNSVVECTVIERADLWALWKLEIVLADGSESRWPEALALAAAAVSSIADSGVPRRLVNELQYMTRATQIWQINGVPRAYELVGDYYKLRAGSTNLGFPSYEGNVDRLVDVANDVAEEISKNIPAITVFTSDTDLFDRDKDAKTLKLPPPLELFAELLPLKMPPPRVRRNSVLPLRPSEAWASYLPPVTKQFLPRFGNPWIPTSFTRDGDIMERGFEVFGKSGLEILRLPRGIGPDDFATLTGNYEYSTMSPLARVYDDNPYIRGGGIEEEPPFAALVLQLDSPVMDEYLKGKPENLALWRLTLLEAFSIKAEAAALWKSIDFDIAFNRRGLQLTMDGYAQHLPNFMSSLLASVLSDSVVKPGSFAFNTSERVLRDVLRLKKLPVQKVYSTNAVITSFFQSVSSAKLLLAGNVARDAAASLAYDINRQLCSSPQLSGRRLRPSKPGDDDPGDDDIERSMRKWREVLERPPLPLQALYEQIRKQYG